MRIYTVLFLFLFLIVSSSSASDLVYPQGQQASQKSDLVWNKWDTENFIVLSLNKSQGLAIKSEIEDIKSSFFKKWGIVDDKFPVKCKLLCVPNRDLLVKLFGIDSPHVEVRRDTEGRVSLCAVWFEFDDIETLPFLLSKVCIADDMSPNKQKWFVQRGVSGLSKPVTNIRQDVCTVGNLSSKEIFGLAREKWSSLTPQERESFDRKSSLVCLLLRKEFGGDRFSKFLSSEQDESCLRSVYGFDSFEKFDATLKRYAENLTKDIQSDITPNSYLQVK